jgi:predicted Zn-dependent peptidase
MFRSSKFEPEEVEKERQVIIQEICREMDTPEARVHTLIKALIWPDHPVGADTAGTKASVSAISRQNMLEYVGHNYTPGSTVISLAGKLQPDQIVEQLGASLGEWQPAHKPQFAAAVEAPTGPRLRVEFKDTEQAHLCVGMRGLSSSDPDRFKLRILNTVLGEGMSSRLFLEIREKRGLAYSVGSYTSHLRDTGAMVLYAGVPPKKASAAVQAMMEQLDLLRHSLVPDAEIRKAKEFTKGHLLLRMEDTFSNADWGAGQEVADRKVLSLNQVIAMVDAVTPQDVQDLAQRMFSTEKLSLAAIGPFKSGRRFRSSLKL